MNRKKVQRLMRKYGLECPLRRSNPLRRIAKDIQTNSVFSNKLNRQFSVGRPDEHLLTDISYLSTIMTCRMKNAIKEKDLFK